MAFCCRGRGQELGNPFLADGFSSPGERREAIAAETETYLAAQAGHAIPGTETLEMPDCLYWLLRVERWGPIRAGGQIDQPYHFIEDLEWAAVGRNRAQRAGAANAAASAAESKKQIKTLNAKLSKMYSQGV